MGFAGWPTGVDGLQGGLGVEGEGGQPVQEHQAHRTPSQAASRTRSPDGGYP